MSDEVTALYDEGLRLGLEGRFDEAVKRFELAVQQGPGHSLADNALLQASLCHAILGHGETSLGQLSRVRKAYAGTDAASAVSRPGETSDEVLSRGDDKALFHKAKTAAADRQFGRAKLLFYRVVAEFPGSSVADNALLNLATVLGAMGEVEQARSTLLYLKEAYPDSDAARLVPRSLESLER